MNRFIERHFALCLVVTLPFAGVAGVALAIGIWDLLMVRAYPALMHVL